MPSRRRQVENGFIWAGRVPVNEGNRQATSIDRVPGAVVRVTDDLARLHCPVAQAPVGVLSGEAFGCLVERADQGSSSRESSVGTPRLRVRDQDERAAWLLRRSQRFAGDVLEHFATLAIEPKRKRCAREASAAKMGEESVHRRRPRSRWSVNGIADSDNPGCRAPTHKRYLFMAHGVDPMCLVRSDGWWLSSLLPSSPPEWKPRPLPSCRRACSGNLRGPAHSAPGMLRTSGFDLRCAAPVAWRPGRSTTLEGIP